MDNPLLESSGRPSFARIAPDHVETAIDFLLVDNRKRIAELVAEAAHPTWDSFARVLEQLDDRLSRAWSPVRHLHAVANSAPLRRAYNACLPKLSHYTSEVGQNQELFRRYKALAEEAANGKLDGAQRQLLTNTLRDFRLAGVDLPPDQQRQFRDIRQRLSALASEFDQNLLDATHAWSRFFTDSKELAGLPEWALEQAHQTAARQGKEGWVLTLEQPSYLAAITHLDDRGLRHEIYEAYTTRASDIGPYADRWDNSTVMEEILDARQRLAEVLGFANFAEHSLATKMAPDTDSVLEFLWDLVERSRPVAEKEFAELQHYAQKHHGMAEVEAWDVPYFSEKLRQHRFSVSQQALKPYFPATRVLPGMFKLFKRLFGIEVSEIVGVETWHPDVRVFQILDESGVPRGEVYLDLYARPHKRGGAWMDVCRDRIATDEEVQIPAAYLCCNFAPPAGDKPALLSHEEVQTLFHEFGHGLHHLLTLVDYAGVAGINGVAWDAVELPSQFLEHWCWDPEALRLISGHWQTGEPLPENLLEKMKASKNFMSGMQMVRQLEFALFDFMLHQSRQHKTVEDIYRLLNDVRRKVAVVHPPDFNRFAHAFTHIFSGGYAAGYYSYKWAEVLACDAFSRFELEGVFCRQTGMDFLHNILEQGGSRDAMDLFVAFRGRAPTVDALVRHSGLGQ